MSHSYDYWSRVVCLAWPHRISLPLMAVPLTDLVFLWWDKGETRVHI